MKKTITIFTLLALALATACEKTGDELYDPEEAGVWTLFNTASGLPSDNVEGIALDRDNNLWVTFPSSGAAKYSNGAWTVYRTTNSEILSDAVTSVSATDGGNIIIGTTDGISVLSANGLWTSYRDPEAATMYINCARVTSAGHIWVGTRDNGLYIDTGSGFTRLDETQFPNVMAIEEDNDNNVYVGTGNGIMKWNGTSWIRITEASGLPSNKVTALRTDNKGRLWVGTADGIRVAYIDMSGIRRISLMAGATATNITDIFEDRRGHMWFSTSGKGVIRYDGVIPHSYKLYNGFFEDDVTCIGEDEEGNLWFGLRSKGLVRYTLPLN